MTAQRLDGTASQQQQVRPVCVPKCASKRQVREHKNANGSVCVLKCARSPFRRALRNANRPRQPPRHRSWTDVLLTGRLLRARLLSRFDRLCRVLRLGRLGRLSRLVRVLRIGRLGFILRLDGDLERGGLGLVGVQRHRDRHLAGCSLVERLGQVDGGTRGVHCGQRVLAGHSFRFGLVGHDLDDLQTIGGERVADRILGLGGLCGHLDQFDGRRLRLLGQGVLCGGEVFSAVATSSTVAFLLAETSLAAG